jgi:hypothetical protein
MFTELARAGIGAHQNRCSVQIGESRPKIQVERLTIDDQRRHGFDAGGSGFSDAASGRTEVYDFKLDLRRIEIAGDDAFGFEAYRATGVVEFCSGLHGMMISILTMRTAEVPDSLC